MGRAASTPKTWGCFNFVYVVCAQICIVFVFNLLSIQGLHQMRYLGGEFPLFTNIDCSSGLCRQNVRCALLKAKPQALGSLGPAPARPPSEQCCASSRPVDRPPIAGFCDGKPLAILGGASGCLGPPEARKAQMCHRMAPKTRKH